MWPGLFIKYALQHCLHQLIDPALSTLFAPKIELRVIVCVCDFECFWFLIIINKKQVTQKYE